MERAGIWNKHFVDRKVLFALFTVTISGGSWLAMKLQGGSGEGAQIKPDAATVARQVNIGDTVDELAMHGINPDRTMAVPNDPDSTYWVFVDKSGKPTDLTVTLTAGVVSDVETE